MSVSLGHTTLFAEKHEPPCAQERELFGTISLCYIRRHILHPLTPTFICFVCVFIIIQACTWGHVTSSQFGTCPRVRVCLQTAAERPYVIFVPASGLHFVLETLDFASFKEPGILVRHTFFYSKYGRGQHCTCVHIRALTLFCNQHCCVCNFLLLNPGLRSQSRIMA